MDQSMLMTMTAPFSYPLKPLCNLPIQRLYFNSPQIRLCHPLSFNCFLDAKQVSFQQGYFQEVLLLQQKQFQDLLISKIAEQETKIKSLTYYSQVCQEEEEASVNRNLVSSHSQPINILNAYENAITHILDYFLSHFGKVSKDKIEKIKARYAYDTVLTELLDVLILRYRAASKSREDMVRFVIRKSLTWLRDQTRGKSQTSARAATVKLCHRYFVTNTIDLQSDKKMLLHSDDELLGLLLPYKKNSRHPVVNSKFIKEIFSSIEFCQDYLEYLAQYSNIMEKENEKKIKQFTDFLVSCIYEKCLHKILSYKRIPWLNIWIETSHGIGYEIYELNASKGETKDLK